MSNEEYMKNLAYKMYNFLERNEFLIKMPDFGVEVEWLIKEHPKFTVT